MKRPRLSSASGYRPGMVLGHPVWTGVRKLDEEEVKVFAAILTLEAQARTLLIVTQHNAHPGDPISEAWWPDPCMGVAPVAGLSQADELTALRLKWSLLTGRRALLAQHLGCDPLGYKVALRMVEGEIEEAKAPRQVAGEIVERRAEVDPHSDDDMWMITRAGGTHE